MRGPLQGESSFPPHYENATGTTTASRSIKNKGMIPIMPLVNGEAAHRLIPPPSEVRHWVHLRWYHDKNQC
jgi:hypothetical protein